MERKRSSRIIAIIAMVIAVIGLTVGFAAFTRTLTIESKATVNTDESTFSVKLSATASTVDDKTPVTTSAKTDNIQTNSATIDNSTNPKKPTIKGLGVTFTKPGQTATYTFYAVNDGEFDAFLKEITFANVDGSNTISGTGDGSTDSGMVTKACGGIEMTVTVDGVAATTKVGTNGSNYSIESHKIAKPVGKTFSSHTITVQLEYKADSTVADGSVTVKIGDVSLKYSSTDQA